MNWFDIKKETDQIDEENFNPDIKMRINRFTTWFVSNIFDRSLSYLVGWTGHTAKMLRCTSGGILKVAMSASGLETNGIFAGTSANAWSVALTFTVKCERFDIWNATNDINISFMNSVGAYLPSILIPAGTFYSIDMTATAVRIQSTVAGSHGVYRIVYYY